MQNYSSLLLFLSLPFALSSCCWPGLCNAPDIEINCTSNLDSIAQTSDDSPQSDTKCQSSLSSAAINKNLKGPFTYGPAKSIDYRLSTKDPGVNAIHTLSFEVNKGDLSTFEAVVTYPKEFTFNGFLSLGPANSNIGSMSADFDMDGTPDGQALVKSEGEFSAYVDFNNNGLNDYGTEPQIFRSMDFSGNHLLRIYAYPSNIISGTSAKVMFVMNSGIFTNPVVTGTYKVSGTFTSVDPTSGGPEDGIGESPQALNYTKTVVKKGDFPWILFGLKNINGSSSPTE